MADSVQLTDLDVIARYSIAVRSATADRDELLETLRADVAWLERGRSRTSTSTSAYQAQPDVDGADPEDEEYEAPSGRPTRPTRSTAKKATPAKRATTRRAPRA